MANTYKLIASTTVGAGGAASITFSSIPSTYTDLKLMVSARSSDYPNPFFYMNLTFNGSTTGYTAKNIRGTGSAVDSGSLSPGYEIDYSTGNTATASSFSSHDFYIPNYTSSNYKSYSQENANETNSTTAYLTMAGALWSNTSAITSVTVAALSGYNLAQYSTAYLYGISKS